MGTLVFGNGWLGKMFARRYNCPVLSVDIVDAKEVACAIEKYRPELVINAAGKCGFPNIDWCAATSDNRRLTWHTNALGPAIVETACILAGVPQFVHLSSGCMWRSGINITEDTPFDPPSFYIKSKAEGEARLHTDYSLIVRFRMPFNSDLNAPRNLIAKLLKYDHLIDEQNSMVFSDDLINTIVFLAEQKKRGVYHITNPGTLSACDVMQQYCAEVDSSHSFKRITYHELLGSKRVACERSNITLSTEKLTAAGMVLPSVRDRMYQCLTHIAEVGRVL